MGFLDRFRMPSLTPAAAAAGVADGTLVLVDVREHHEWRGGHAPKAQHIPLGSLPASLEKLGKGGRPVAFVCQSGMRSRRATSIARAAGLDAHNVSGGMAAWQRAGLPVR